MIPLPGLSLLTHLLIILVKKMGGSFEFLLKIKEKPAAIISGLIIFFVTVSVLTNSFLIIRGALKEENNLVLVSKIVASREAIAQNEVLPIKEQDWGEITNRAQFLPISESIDRLAIGPEMPPFR